MRLNESKLQILSPLASLAFHAILICLLFLASSKESRDELEPLTYVELKPGSQQPTHAPRTGHATPNKSEPAPERPHSQRSYDFGLTHRGGPARHDSTSDSVSTEHAPDSALSLRPAHWEANQSLNRRLEQAGFFNDLAQRIKAHLTYRQELADRGYQGVIRVAIRVDSYGNLKKMNLLTSGGDARLRGWLLHLLNQALRDSRRNWAGVSEAQATVEVHFRILHPDDVRPDHPPEITGNTLAFFLDAKAPASFDLTQHSIESNILTRLMGGPKAKDDREAWDLSFRKQRAIHACEIQRAEGACLAAGKIELTLGHETEARKWLQQACDLKLETGCQELARLESGE